MQKEQIKTLITNIIIVATIIGVLMFVYFVFKNKTATILGGDSGTSGTTAKTTADIGAEISRTRAILRDLDTSVKFSAMIFRLPSFESLEDFSVEVPAEEVGRENPFTPTPWKLEQLKIMSAVSGGAPADEPTQATTTLPKVEANPSVDVASNDSEAR